MAKEQTAEQIEKQLLVLRRAISKFPQEEVMTREQKNRYYPLKGKIKNLEQALIARKQFEFEAR